VAREHLSIFFLGNWHQQMKINLTAVQIFFFASCILACPLISNAAPFVPSAGSDIVDQLPIGLNKTDAASATRESRRALAALNQNKNNLDVALNVARLNIRRARIESDPRYLGQAEAALMPWIKEAQPPITVLILRATIRQSLHQFANARADLEQVIAREPANAQAWLKLATVAQVTGDTVMARTSCSKLSGLVEAPIHATCVAAIDGATGQAKSAAALIAKTLQTARGSNRELRGWIATLQAELYERAGQNQLAEKRYREAIALDKRDAYATAAFADFLLDQRRANEVLKLIPAETDADILLLRRALAAHDLKLAEAKTLADKLAARYDVARARNGQLHLREEARFVLHMRGNPGAALKLAQQNWQTQKEPADLRILLEAAVATGQRANTNVALTWLDKTRLEGCVVAQLAAEARRL
jgi:Tfp pilus assembly protein PilF